MSRLDPNGRDKKGPKRVVQMGPSSEEIQGEVNSPEEVPSNLGPIQTAASYGERVRARQAATASLKKKGKPLGGAPPIDPKKMGALASSMAPQPSFGEPPVEEDQDPQEFRVPQDPPASLGGVGAAYEVNQQMAKGKINKPVSMKEAKKIAQDAKQGARQLSPETIEGLQQMQAQPPEDPEPQQELDYDEETESGLEDATRKILERDTPFNYDAISEQKDTLLSKERKAAIESRLVPLDIADMIVRREIEQEIPVIPGKLVYTLRTFNQRENLFCLQHVYENPGSVTYAEEFLNTCKLVCSLVAINGARLPNHVKDEGSSNETIDKELFKKKMFHVASFPTQVIADLSVQAIWFNQRVNKLFSVDNLKNG